MTRLAKVDFLRFNDENVKEWLFKVEEFFGIDNTPIDLRVRLASIHFDQMAAACHQSLAQSDGGKLTVRGKVDQFQWTSHSNKT